MTICTHLRAFLFGDVVGEEMRLNELGEIAEWTWRDLPNRVAHVELDAFVIMPNHLHLIAAAANGNLGEIMRDFKTYTSKELVKLIGANPRESRKEWMLRVFREHGAANPQNVHYQFWQQSNRPIILDKPELFDQRRRYLRENPLRAGLVNDESAYMWSSANPHLDFECDAA